MRKKTDICQTDCFKLRQYQINAINKIYTALSLKQNVLLKAIMGAGKTVISVCLCQEILKKNPDIKILILAHKQELIQQFEKAFYKFTKIPNNKIGICCSGFKKNNIKKQITIATIQTFINYSKKYIGAGFIIVDECHKINMTEETQYKKVINNLRGKRDKSRLLGITATDFRLDTGFIGGDLCKPGTINLFDKPDYIIGYADLLAENYLVPLKGIVARHDMLAEDLETANRHGDFVLGDIGDIMGRERHIKTTIDAIHQYCSDYKKICVFCCTIEHAEKVWSLIREEAVLIHSQLSQIERANNIRSWMSGRKRIAVSINILVEGFDLPELDCLVFARPTLSPALFLQAVGRVLRIADGKNHGLLVDLTDNTERFGNDLDNIKITVPKAVQDKIDAENSFKKSCPKCQADCHIALKICMKCGYEWPEQKYNEAIALPDMKEVDFTPDPPKWYDVDAMRIVQHYNKKRETMLGRLIFEYGDFFKTKTVSVFFCFPDYYSGYAVEMSKKRWQEFSNDPFPEDVEQFLEKEIFMPVKILLDENKKYPEIIDYEWTPF